jgi:hypothetical protein
MKEKWRRFLCKWLGCSWFPMYIDMGIGRVTHAYDLCVRCGRIN